MLCYNATAHTAALSPRPASQAQAKLKMNSSTKRAKAWRAPGPPTPPSRARPPVRSTVARNLLKLCPASGTATQRYAWLARARSLARRTCGGPVVSFPSERGNDARGGRVTPRCISRHRI